MDHQSFTKPSLVARLPNDLLVEIFGIIAKGHPAFLSAVAYDNTKVVELFDSHIEATFTLIGVSHVCRRWRSCVIDRPSFWTLIASDYPKPKLDCFLQRSKTAYLSVIYGPSEKSGEFGSLVKNEMSRIQRLKIIDKSWPIARELLLLPAPHLKYLDLDMGDMRRSDGCYFLPPLFSGVSPNLTVLKLQYCVIDWQSGVFKNLKELLIMNVSEYSAYRPKIDNLFSVLEHCPDLESLILINTGPLDSVTSIEGGNRIITLPHLNHLLVVNMESKVCSKFLSRLSFTNVNLKWEILFGRNTYHFNPDTNVHITPRILDNTLQYYRLILFIDKGYFGIQAYKANSEKSALFRVQNERQNEIGTTTDEFCRHFHQIVRDGFSQSSTMLSICIGNSEFKPDENCWHTLLRAFPSLQGLAIMIDWPIMDPPLVITFFNMLGRHSDSWNAQSNGSFVSPSLKCLLLLLRYQEKEEQYDSSVVTAILECLHTMKEDGRQFEILELPLFKFSAESRLEIGSLVSDMRWTE